MLKVLIVDDEMDFRSLLGIILKRRGFTVKEASNGIEAKEMLEKEHYDVLLTDLVMDKCDGLELLEHASTKYPGMDTIIMTAFGSIENAVMAMKKGAFSYFIKSNDPQEILFDLEKISKIKKLGAENRLLRDAVVDNNVMLESKSEAFQRAIDIAKRAAASNSNILILGDSGVGKEVFAKFIHMNSQRRDNVFMPVNCFSFSDSLIESELYGHENGAFTGSVGQRIGRFEAANNGTLFLDEVGDLPESTQIKILRNLESREITRIGSNVPIRTDFRLISATNKDLSQAIQNMKFREDLYYRLGTVIIRIPPLRERREDIPILIDYFIDKSSKELKRTFHSIEPKLKSLLYTYDYPGNVREMKNIIERLAVLSPDGILTMDEAFSINPLEAHNTDQSLKSVRSVAEKKHIESMLHVYDYDYNKASEALKISSRQLYNKCNEYGIKKGT